MLDDYIGFLQFQKAKWRQQQANKESRRRLFGSSSESSQRSAVGSLIRKQAANLVGVQWEILQYMNLVNEPGVVKAFVSAAGKVHTFRFRIPKTFYVSFKVEPSETKLLSLKQCIIEKLNSILPNGHNGEHLYKFEMPEEVYEEELRNPDSILQSSSILGIYETQINAVDRAIIALGNLVRFDDTQVGSLGKGLRNGFNLKDLHKVDVSKLNGSSNSKTVQSYLRRFNMDVLYLLHIVTNSYEFYVLFKLWDSESHIFVLKPSASAQELPQTLDKIYSDIYQAKKEKLGKLYNIIDYRTQCKSENHYFTSHEKLMKRVNGFTSKVQ